MERKESIDQRTFLQDLRFWTVRKWEENGRFLGERKFKRQGREFASEEMKSVSERLNRG